MVPVAEMALDPADTVFFEHHAMLWKDETVHMSVMTSPGGAKRLLAGMPFVLSVARGPGRVACSRDASGELVVLPLDPPTELDVREHAMLLATSGLTYSFEKVPGLTTMLVAGTGMYLERFVAQAGPGLLVLHGYGNVFERVLGAGESVQVEPGGFLYKDASVGMEVQSVKLGSGEPSDEPAAVPVGGEPTGGGGSRFGRGLKGLKTATSRVSPGGLVSAAGNLRSGGGLPGAASGLLGGRGFTLMRLTGPGRVGIQSMFRAHDTA